MVTRFASALILLGVIALVVFLVTLSSGDLNLLVLLLGACLCAIGLLLRRLAKGKPADFEE
jgi:hypothetical protein